MKMLVDPDSKLNLSSFCSSIKVNNEIAKEYVKYMYDIKEVLLSLVRSGVVQKNRLLTSDIDIEKELK